MRFFMSPSALRLSTAFAILVSPTLLGARGCVPGDSHELCPTVFAPVCGTDGVTYGNACEADAAAVEIAHDGTCECAPVLCDLYCEFGSATDATGCETCACNPPPVCDEVLCDLYCEHGFAVDPTTGCETCSCSEPPTTCVSDADCAADELCLLTACAAVCDESGDCSFDCGPGSCEPRAIETYCTSDADCGDGGFCDIVGCERVEDAGPGEPRCGVEPSCYGFCRALPPPPPPSECTSDADCGEGATCDVSACLPVGDVAVCGGLCRPIEPTPTLCESDVDCGEGAHCEAIACAAVCGIPDDGVEETCVWDCRGGVCTIDVPPAPSCESDADCAPGQGCVALAVDCACIAEPCDCPSGGLCQWLEDDARGPMGI